VGFNVVIKKYPTLFTKRQDKYLAKIESIQNRWASAKAEAKKRAP
jgi:hypothetical protein